MPVETSLARWTTQNVFRLEVPMVDSKPMAVGNGFQNLKKCILCSNIITNIPTSLCNIAKEISFRAVLHDHVGVFTAIHDPQKGDNVGVRRNLVM